MLEIKDISLGYEDKIVIKDVNFKVEKGKIITLIGSNGCGKSTILKAISRTLKPKNGCVYLDGESIFKVDTKILAKKLSILPQTPKIPDDFTVRDLVSYGRYPHTGFYGKLGEKDIEIIDWAIKETKIDNLQHRQVATLSGGERQRTWIALALAQQPEVLILDEPTTFLDICYQFEVLELVKRLNKSLNLTIIMVLHDLNQAARYSNEIIAVKNGSIYKKGEPNEVINEKLLADIFSIKAKIVYDDDNKCPYFIPIDSL